MITKQMRKDVKFDLYAQLVLAIIYVIIGSVISIFRIVNSSYTFDQVWILGLSMLLLGIVYTIRNTVILFNSGLLRKKIIKTYDPSNNDIRIKAIKRAYYSFYAFGLIFATLMAEKLSEASAAIIMVMMFTLLMHGIYWLYLKISYNIKNSKENEDEGGEELNE
jgi:hypothetical protein